MKALKKKANQNSNVFAMKITELETFLQTIN